MSGHGASTLSTPHATNEEDLAVDNATLHKPTLFTLTLITPPKQRQKWNDEPFLPHTNWGDIFFDLFFVAATYNGTYIMQYDPNWEGAMYFVGCFGILYNTFWYSKVEFDSRFEVADDLVHFFWEVLFTLLTAGGVLHMQKVDYLLKTDKYLHMTFFCAANVGGILLMILRYIEVGQWVNNSEGSVKAASRKAIYARIPALLLMSAATAITGIAWLQSNEEKKATEDDYYTGYAAGGDNSTNTTLFAAAYPSGSTSYKYTGYGRLEFPTTKLSKHVPIILCLIAWVSGPILYYILNLTNDAHEYISTSLPMNVDFIMHRYGEYTMLMFGAIVMSLLIVDPSLEDGSDEFYDYYQSWVIGIISVILLQYLHFKEQPHHAADNALTKNRHYGWLFTVFMNIYGTCLVVLGSCYKLILMETTYTYKQAAGNQDERRKRIAQIFSVSMLCVLVLQTAMSLCHKGPSKLVGKSLISRLMKVLRLAVYLGLVVLVFFVGWKEPDTIAQIGIGFVLIVIFTDLVTNYVEPPVSHGDHDHDDHHYSIINP
mmetsp:Transcript_22852/g.45699  ORF Transcript_22852/g.45699 Transcript_22852/m.45699 type:complete len:542 (-) Transcript_22852:333-1958(-)